MNGKGRLHRACQCILDESINTRYAHRAGRSRSGDEREGESLRAELRPLTDHLVPTQMTLTHPFVGCVLQHVND